MQRRPFGSLGIDVPVIGIGTWNMERDDRASCVAAIRRAIDAGMTHVDTAEMYGSGKVETLVGEAIAGRRDEVFLASKVLPNHATYDGTLRACEQSLKRLATDHLDLYLLHWREELPLEPTFRAFEELRQQGKIRAWGVSNFDDGDLDDAVAIVGEGKLACNQVLYHLGERTIEHEVIPWCERHGVAVVAYSPFGSTHGFPRSRPLEALAKRLGATPRQVALAFLTRRASVFAIPKTCNASHVDELAHHVTLDAAAVAELEQTFPLPAWRGLAMI
ncbi:MAG: aldo/keto reductase [Acidobacteriota bacterium]